MKYLLTVPLKTNLKVIINRLGYHTRSHSYMRRLSGSNYPRFHLHINEKENGILFNLHLDEKQPSYQGQKAHSGQYEGELVQQEMDRIKKVLIS